MSGWILYFTYCLIRYFVNDYTSYNYIYTRIKERDGLFIVVSVCLR